MNYKYIFQIRANEVVMDDGTILPLSKYRVKEVKEKFIVFLLKHLQHICLLRDIWYTLLQS